MSEDDRSSSRTPSRTAAGVAWLRAAHQIVDGLPRILDDPVAPLLLGDSGRRAIDERRSELLRPGALALRAHVLLRSRFAEDRLRVAVDRGVDQYVILGAGLDTFAYRQPAWAAGIRIFEVDQPASQRVKRERVTRAGIAVPANLTYLDIDFEAVDLLTGLGGGGVDPSRPVFVSWLGVSMYLTRDAVTAVFASVAAFPVGSELVFTFAQPRPAGPSLADRAAAVGEPWLSYFEPGELRALLTSAGFGVVEFLGIDEAARYFVDRTDLLMAPQRISIAAARRSSNDATAHC